MMSDRVLELTNVALRNDRGGYVFRDLTLSVKQGESAIITGSSGSGKTSMIELVTGLRFADSGSVEVFGEQVARGRRSALRRIRRRIGGVGGPFGLLPAMTVSENILLPMILAGIRKKARAERLLAVMTEFSLLKVASVYPDSLTRVETTLALMARASVAHQPLMIIDEPLAGLDKSTWERVVASLRTIALSGRSMLLLSSELSSHEIPNSRHYNIENGALV
jgi:ABC-type ATPase involved in cell division